MLIKSFNSCRPKRFYLELKSLQNIYQTLLNYIFSSNLEVKYPKTRITLLEITALEKTYLVSRFNVRPVDRRSIYGGCILCSRGTF